MEYNSLKEKIAAEKAARAAKHESYEKLFNEACAAGYAAGDHMTPKPMGVVDPVSGQAWRVNEGLCGFASVIVRKANTGFGHWLIKTGKARRAYYGGAEIWIGAHNQSYERKEAHARAMAHVIKESGFDAYSTSRLD